MKINEDKIGKEIRVYYDKKTVKGFVKSIDDKFIVLETRKEYYIPLDKITRAV